MKLVFRRTKVRIPDDVELDEILTRSIDTIYPTKDMLKSLLLKGEQLRIYVGIDPTASYVHLGHSTNYIILKRLHALGHKIIVLIGDFTAMIGDPSDKSAARKQLTVKDVKENLKTFKEQISAILPFNDRKNPIEFTFNSKWLGKLTLKELAELGSHFTVAQMLERDNFKNRMREEKPLYVHEFFYPLMQGYDSVALEADIEIGGTDQTFNMLAGRTLVKQYQNREKLVVTTTLLENPVTGEKLMSKSLGTGIGLNESPENMYGKVMRLPDEAIRNVFVDCTYLTLSEIEILFSENVNPRDIKMRLAREIVKIYHGEKVAIRAEGDFVQKFQEKGGIPEDIETHTYSADTKLVDALVLSGAVESKGEVRRLMEQGAITLLDTDTKITDVQASVAEGNYRIGKHRFVKIVVK